jgi:hypothetical protein
MAPINTKDAPRRDLQFADLNAILADLDRLESAENAGTLIQNGNWSLGQNAFHIADIIEQSLDGFRFSAPLPIRVAFRIMRPFMMGRPFPAGIALKGNSLTLIPDPAITTEQGLAKLRTQIQRIIGGERMTLASPIFGKLSHEQWVTLHCKHADLHLSFLDPGAT